MTSQNDFNDLKALTENMVNSLADLNKSLVRICNNIELVTAIMINDTVDLSDDGEFRVLSSKVINRATSLKDLIRTSRRENKVK